MFYLFNVNQGCAQQLEVTAALGTVRNLQRVIEEITGVPVQEQVLLINGGEGLQSDRAVSCYQCCGTESNPVFLFYKFPEDRQRNCEPDDFAEIVKMCEEIIKKLKLYDDAAISSALVHRYIESSRSACQATESAYQFCSRIFQEHQFLYQGWLALMSNFDECRNQIQKRVEKFFVHYEKMKLMKAKAQAIVQGFDSALELMEKITIPATLLSQIPGLEAGKKLDGGCTLYDFIAAADPKNSLRDVVTGVLESVDQMDDNACKEVKMHQEAMQTKFGKPEWQEIGGINGRFQHLDKELRVLEQRTTQMKQISSIIVQAGKNPCCSIKDVVLKQRAQVVEVLKILDYVHNAVKSFMNSKQEVLHNIRERLSKLALKAYDHLHTLNNAVTVYEEKYFGLRNRLDIIKQVKESPIVYMIAVAETVRRSALQQEFMSWFSKFMDKSQTLVREEAALRDSFAAKLEHHFLKQLFSGLFDPFPSFAPTQLPDFDQNLPSVDVDYVSFLRQTLPTYAHLLKVDKPFINSRLAISELQPMYSTVSTSALQMKDDQSLPSGSPASDKIGKNFGSINWLSGDENTDLSPSNAVFFAKTPTSQLGSSLEFEIPESKQLNSFLPAEVLFSSKESVVSTAVTSVENLPVKFASQSDSPIKHYEFHNIQRVNVKDISERLKAVLGEIKGFAESMHLLQDLLAELHEVFDASVKKMIDNVSGFSSPPIEEGYTDLKKPAKSITVKEDFILKLRGRIGKNLSLDCERELEDEIRKAKKQFEANCKMHCGAEIKSKVEEAKKLCSDKAKRELHVEFAKFESEIRNSELRDNFDELLEENSKLLLKDKVVAGPEEQYPVDAEFKGSKNTATVPERHENDDVSLPSLSSSLCETEFQAEFAHWKLKILKAYSDCYTKALSKAVQETEKNVENKWLNKYKILKNEYEQREETVRKECEAKYAAKLEEERERVKKEVEKVCAMFQKERSEDSLADDARPISALISNREKTALAETNAANNKITKSYSEMVLEGMKKSLKRESLPYERGLKKKEVKDDICEKIAVVKGKSPLQEKDFQQEEQKFHSKQPQENSLIAKPFEKFVMIRSEEEQFEKSSSTKETTPMDCHTHEMENSAEKSSFTQSLSMSQPIATNNRNLDASVCVTSIHGRNENCSGEIGTADGLYNQLGKEDDEKSEGDIAALAVTSRRVQTKIRDADFRYLIAIQDLHELSTVLVTFSEEHGAFMLFSVNSTLYFVKESCLRRLGLKSDQITAEVKKNFIVAVITRMEFCRIRKVNNRYHLASGTRLYRVEVEPLAIESSVRRANYD
uniref:ATG11 domain-containing protein n=1 Tax=Syphacia muris TaxID=451379 RepID=A0A0N5AEZ0_9BILA